MFPWNKLLYKSIRENFVLDDNGINKLLTNIFVFGARYQVQGLKSLGFCAGPNAAGSRAPIEVTSTVRGDGFATYTGTSLVVNSVKTWRHTPHGVAKKSSCCATTAIDLNSRNPSLTALATAVRSPQIDGPYAAFSTLQPDEMVPFERRIAAPTLKLLYGLLGEKLGEISH